jgi:hypothetical protein
MKVAPLICACALLTACNQPFDDSINAEYVKDCNDRGGRVERIEYSDQLQCIGATTKGDSK